MTGAAPAGELALLCRARGRSCVLPLARVVETMRPLDAVPVAGAPAFVVGVSMIRGEPTPVVDIGALLDTDEPASLARYVTVRISGRQIALGFEEVLGLREIPAGSSLPPLLKDARASAVSAVATLDAELLLVLDAARLIPDGVWPLVDGEEHR